MSLFCSAQGQGENLVLLHGWGMNSAVWEGLLPYLQAHYCVHIVDLPGHGRSEVLADALGDDLLNAWLEALSNTLPERFYLCGWSLGGMLALALQQRWPARVQGVVMLAASPRFVQTQAWPGLSLDALLSFAQDLQADVQVALRQFIGLQFLGVKNSRATVRRILEELQQQGQASPAGLLQGLLLLQNMDLREGFSAYSCAVLLGGRDKLVPAALGPAMRALNADARVEVWPSSGHATHFVQPEQVAEFILCHLNDKAAAND